MPPMSEPVEPHRLRGAAKRAIAPLERRVEIAVTRAVETTIRREIAELRDAVRADIATLVELTYELERLAHRVDEALAAMTAAAGTSTTADTGADG